MKQTTIVYRLTALVGIGLGAFALSAFANSYTPPPCSDPTQCNANPPVQQVGSTKQDISTGLLGLSAFVFNPSGTPGSVTPGSVLTAADSDGNVTWGSAGAAGNPGTAVITNSGVWNIPSGVTTLKIRVWGAGGGGGCGGVNDGSGGGGGGGGYAEKTEIVPSGQTQLYIQIGAGGAGYALAANGTCPEGYSGTYGGTTSVYNGSSASGNPIASASGGAGGSTQWSSGTYGGSGGMGQAGDLTLMGYAGSPAGSGVFSPFGDMVAEVNNGPHPLSWPANNPYEGGGPYGGLAAMGMFRYGVGGAGGKGGNSANAGSNGMNGVVIIEYH